MGRNAVREILSHSPQRIQKIFIAETHGRRDNSLENLVKEAHSKRIVVEELPSEALTQLVGSESHQSVVVWLKERVTRGLKETLAELENKEQSLVLVLDSIQDPQNLGALFRAAECFGVDMALFSSNRGATLTPVVCKASVGASEIIKIVAVSNLADSIRKLKEANYWVVVADADPGGTPLDKFKFPGRTAIVLGSEGKGVQSLVKSEADFVVYAALCGRISSLNVSQAAAVFLHSYRLQIS